MLLMIQALMVFFITIFYFVFTSCRIYLAGVLIKKAALSQVGLWYFNTAIPTSFTGTTFRKYYCSIELKQPWNILHEQVGLHETIGQ